MIKNKKQKKNNTARNVAIGAGSIGLLAGGAYLLTKKRGGVGKSAGLPTLGVNAAAATKPVKLSPKVAAKVAASKSIPIISPKTSAKVTAPSTPVKTKKFSSKDSFLSRLNKGTDGLPAKEGFLSKKRPGKSKEVLSVRKLDSNHLDFLSKIAVDKKTKRASTRGLSTKDKSKLVDLRKVRQAGYDGNAGIDIGRSAKEAKGLKGDALKANRKGRKVEAARLKESTKKLAGSKLYFSRYGV